MEFIPVPNTMMCALIYDQAGEVTQNTLFFSRTFGLDPETLETAAAQLANWWFVYLSDWQSVNVQLRNVIAADLTTITSYVATYTPSSVTGGNSEAAPLPNNVSGCISFRTPFRGRSFRGRNYTVGMTLDFLASANTMTSAYMTAVQTAYNTLVTAPPEETLTWVVASRFSGGLPRAEGIVTPITSAGFANNVTDSQRRRLPGRGS
jgi:hypothetical protein